MRGAARNLNIEVLRCFLMLVIVVYHGSNNGPFQVPGAYPETKLPAWFLTWATNAFVFISGWYGIRFGWQRLAKFIGMGVFASLVLLSLSHSVLGYWHYRFSLGWFGNSYLALMLLAPLINGALDSLSQRSEEVLRHAWICYSLAMALSWLPLNAFGISLSVPGWDGHSLNTLLYVYVTAYVLKRWPAFCDITRQKALALFAVAMLSHLSLMVLHVAVPACKMGLGGAMDYNSPAVLVAGAMVFVLFAKTEFPLGLQRMCGWAAPSMFSVYLLYTGAVSKVGGLAFDSVILSLSKSIDGVGFSPVCDSCWQRARICGLSLR